MNSWKTEVSRQEFAQVQEIAADALNAVECLLKDLHINRDVEPMTKDKWYSSRAGVRKELTKATDVELERIEVSIIHLRRHRQLALEQGRG
ncbi:MAG: hypothetical protein OFPI_39660 [Osedax symbiont Rs2]|nr:MAG: hypothetical protein OFPI_39660 [Osedax symbiont Rs2]